MPTQALEDDPQRGEVCVKAVDPDTIDFAGHVSPEGVLLVFFGQNQHDIIPFGQQDNQKRLQTADVIGDDDETAVAVIDVADDLDTGDDGQDHASDPANDAKIGPGRNSNSPARWSNTFVPTTSAGNRSEVHCTRAYSASIERASERASAVLPTPGKSSSTPAEM